MGDEKEDWNNEYGYIIWRNDNVGRLVVEYWLVKQTREGKEIPILQRSALTADDAGASLADAMKKYPYLEPVHVDPDKVIQVEPSTVPKPGTQHVLFAKHIPGIGMVKVVRWPDDDHYLMLDHRLYNLKHLAKHTI